MDDFITRMVELGEARLVSLQPPSRIEDFIEKMIAFGQPTVDEAPALLSVFKEEFIESPDRFRHELLGITAMRRRHLFREHPELRDQLAVLEMRPDLLDPIGRLRRETAHTRALAWVMSPERRRFGVRALRAFLEIVASQKPVATKRDEQTPLDWLLKSSLDRAELIAERSFPSFGRVDLSIHVPGSALVLVEAKVDAAERDEQLKDYQDAAICSRCGDESTAVVFLNLDETVEPTTHSLDLLDECPVVHVTFAVLLRRWLSIFSPPPDEESRYAALYLASLARVCAVGGPGEFDDWDFIERHRVLNFLADLSFAGGQS